MSSTTTRHPVRAVIAAGLLILGVGAMARSCASGPTTTITGAGTYEVGDDIVAGYWAITKPAGTRADPCTFSVWQGDYELLSSAAGGSGIPLREGQTLIVTGNCGTWSKR
jgi:hypothetical protein